MKDFAAGRQERGSAVPEELMGIPPFSEEGCSEHSEHQGGWGWLPVRIVGLCWAIRSWEGRTGGPSNEGQRIPPRSRICLFSLGLLLAQVPGQQGLGRKVTTWRNPTSLPHTESSSSPVPGNPSQLLIKPYMVAI